MGVEVNDGLSNVKWVAAGFCLSLVMAGIGYATEPWVEVRSPHFTVVSDSSANEARGVALRFERVRAVFKKAFPEMRVYPALPILVLAVKNERVFQSLEPPSWRGPGAVRRTGLLLRNPDKNYILLQLGIRGEDPYHVVYHEYAHLVLEDDFQNIPLWINEGLAEFYGNSDFGRGTVRLGLPSKQNLLLLRTHPLLPLATIFTVDQASPYYNEQEKGTIFYAEAWALTDYLMFSTPSRQRGPIDEYLRLMAGGADPVRAAEKAFGNLQQLQSTLSAYVARSAFGYYRLQVNNPAGLGSSAVEKLSQAQSEAIRGDFMARIGNLQEAKTLLQDALARDPRLSFASQSLGLAELREGNPSQAFTYFKQAAVACSECRLARFYCALALMRGHPDAVSRAAIEKTLRSFIDFNPAYAPPFASLAGLVGEDGNLAQAEKLATKASLLDPRQIRYLFLKAEILLKMGDRQRALEAAQKAVAIAASPQEKSKAYVFLGTLQEELAGGSNKQ
ncbi:MAG: hypothetical protein KGM47_17220 [Acidobacteriota bacterium]|nr:hypothetical protein [Acidobacteriota bacterium]